MSSALSARQRYLLRAALEGRVFFDVNSDVWLDQTVRITSEFRILIRRGYAQLHQVPHILSKPMWRVVCVTDDPSDRPDWWF